MVSKNTVIAFLLCTGVLLGVILIFQLHPSYAGSSSRAGDYVAGTSRLEAGTDLLWLINVHSQQLIAYGVDRNGIIVHLGRLDLDVIFQPMPTTMAPDLRRSESTTPATPRSESTTPAKPRKRTKTTVVP